MARLDGVLGGPRVGAGVTGGVRLVDARRYFSDVVADLMLECGLGADALRPVAAECAAHFPETWDELMLWVACGDDAKARTRALLRAQVGAARARPRRRG